MRIRESIRAFTQMMRLRRISAARERLTYLLETTPRYWRSMSVGGGSAVDLGQMTRAEAIEMVNKSGFPIVYVDNDEAFIATKAIDVDPQG